MNRFNGVLIHVVIIKLPRERETETDVENVAGLADLTCRLCTYETLSGEGLYRHVEHAYLAVVDAGESVVYHQRVLGVQHGV